MGIAAAVYPFRARLCKLWMSHPLWKRSKFQLTASRTLGRLIHIIVAQSTGVLKLHVGEVGNWSDLRPRAPRFPKLADIC